MTVYVDDVEIPYGRMLMCHCWTDGDISELLDMMNKIGVSARWIQKPPEASWWHFDISLARKRRALEFGAVLTDRFGPMEHVARLRLNHADESVRRRAARDLSRIRRRRAGWRPLPYPFSSRGS